MKTKRCSIKTFNTIQNYIFDQWKTEIIFELLSDGSSEYDPNENVITLSYKENDKIKNNSIILSVLLHEAGHAAIIRGNNWNQLRFHFSSMEDFHSKCRTKNKFIDLIREEILAWEKGWAIAKELKLSETIIPWKVYHKTMQKYIWSYLRWITAVRGWEK